MTSCTQTSLAGGPAIMLAPVPTFETTWTAVPAATVTGSIQTTGITGISTIYGHGYEMTGVASSPALQACMPYVQPIMIPYGAHLSPQQVTAPVPLSVTMPTYDWHYPHFAEPLQMRGSNTKQESHAKQGKPKLTSKSGGSKVAAWNDIKDDTIDSAMPSPQTVPASPLSLTASPPRESSFPSKGKSARQPAGISGGICKQRRQKKVPSPVCVGSALADMLSDVLAASPRRFAITQPASLPESPQQGVAPARDKRAPAHSDESAAHALLELFLR